MKIAAQTPEEVKALTDHPVQWIEQKLSKAKDHNPIVNTVHRLALLEGLTDRQFYVLLAYHALVKAENLEQALKEVIGTQAKQNARTTSPDIARGRTSDV